MHSTVELALIFFLTLACRYVLVSGAPSRGDGPFPRTLWELEHAESAEGTFRRQGVLQVTDAEVDWGSGSEYDSAENELGVGLEKEKVDVPGWLDPRIHGGRMLDFTLPRYGEPLNVIISAHSDPYIMTESGFRKYAQSIGFSHECLGLHFGAVHFADLGDGGGKKPEQFLARQEYFPLFGTCWESVIGGNHFRAWKQYGNLVKTGAWFLGVSVEKDSRYHHEIATDGYNKGRDLLVSRATNISHHSGIWWKASVEWNVNDLLQPGKVGVNHNITLDGRVAILTVKRLWALEDCDRASVLGVAVSATVNPVGFFEMLFRCVVSGWRMSFVCFQSCGAIPVLADLS